MKKKSIKKKAISAEDKSIISDYFQSKNSKNIKAFTDELLTNMGKKLEPFVKFDDISTTNMVYENINDNNMGLHIGQRKLLMNEIQFLTIQAKTKVKYCIYAGSAPGNKTYLLSQLFPDIKFILIDPNIFNLVVNEFTNHRTVKNPNIIHIYSDYTYEGNSYGKNKKIKEMTASEKKDLVNFISESNYKLFIIEDYMTNIIAELLASLNCTFISDIRSNAFQGITVSDFDIVWNMAMMFNWINILKPDLSVFKFRIPFYNAGVMDFTKHKDIYGDTFEVSKKFGIDFIKNYNAKKFYLTSSVIYLQPWASRGSTEMRSVIYKKDIINQNIIIYNTKEIENKLFSFNVVSRILYHKNSNADKELNFCNCNDCAIENTIWVNYFKLKIKQTIAPTIKDAVIIAGKVTQRPLTRVHTNNVWGPIKNLKQYKEMYTKVNKSTYYNNTGSQKGERGIG